jgi:TRAP transporter TAXI family solute receptor
VLSSKERSNVFQKLAAILCAIVFAASASTTSAAASFKIVTGPERGTYIQIGRDLARFVAADADIDLEVLPSASSAENVRRLRHEPGVKFALVQSDVYKAFLDRAAAGNSEAATLIRPLRVVIPLYAEELYFIVRADSPLEYLHQIEGMRINVGPVGSGTALSATTLYHAMFDVPMPEQNASYLSNEDALVNLVTDRSIDVVVVVAGQPAKLLADMKPESKQYIRLLRFDRDHVSSLGALMTYFPATVRASSYPNLLSEDVPSLAVKSYLVTYAFNLKSTQSQLVRFARSMCRQFPTLQTLGHPKWLEVELALPPLGRGWSYYDPVERELRACGARTPSVRAPAPAARACPQHERVIGLCSY